MTLEAIQLGVLIFIAAMLYSSVGHAGASGYLAAMGLYDVKATVMKPTALVLNIFVASIGTYRFARAGCFDWRLFWPFALLSVPLAFVGGGITLPGHLYKQIVGGVLLFAAANLLLRKQTQTPGRDGAVRGTDRRHDSPAREAHDERKRRVAGESCEGDMAHDRLDPQGDGRARLTGEMAASSSLSTLGAGESWHRPHRYPPIWISIICGGALGLLAGMTGTGGGIFLSPLLVLTGWADPRRTAGISAAFILVNSIAGLAGQIIGVQGGKSDALGGLQSVPHEIMLWAPAAVVGGLIGSYFGAKRLGNPTLRRLLAVVLVIAGVKMAIT
jgi:uncharacterized membrane protein YfcA